MVESRQHTRKVALIGLTIVFLVVGFVWFIYWLVWGRFAIYTDDAYVNGNIVQLMSQVPGTVIEINADDTQLVVRGQTVIKLDTADMEVALQREKANLANTVRRVRGYFENAQEAQETLILRNADLMQAQQDLKRRVGLVGERAISREEMQHYKTTVDVAQARYKTALYNLRASFALVQNAHLYTHPAVERMKANVKMAYLNLQRTTIVAPVTGYVAKRSVQVGQQITLNTPMLAIIPLNEIWIDANYKESQLNRIRIGQPVTVFVDAYPDVKYQGKIIGLGAGTGAAFSLLPPQNATGNWIKIVQRLPVRVGLQQDEIKKFPLRIGLSSQVTTDTRNIKGNRLATVPNQRPVYSTDVYANQLKEANTLIDTILRENSPDVFLDWPQQYNNEVT